MDLTILNARSYFERELVLLDVKKFCYHSPVAGNFGVGRRPKRRENKDSMENENRASLVPRVLSTAGLSNAAKFRKRHKRNVRHVTKCVQGEAYTSL